MPHPAARTGSRCKAAVARRGPTPFRSSSTPPSRRKAASLGQPTTRWLLPRTSTASFITVATPQTSALAGRHWHVSDSTSYTAAAVPFAFENIGATGTIITGLTNQDDASVSIPIGFTFPFYGANNTTVFVSSNGVLSFGSAFTTLHQHRPDDQSHPGGRRTVLGRPDRHQQHFRPAQVRSQVTGAWRESAPHRAVEQHLLLR